MLCHGSQGDSVSRRKWSTVSNTTERQSKNKTDMSTGFGNTKVAVDIDESSSSVLEVGVVVVGSQMGMH